MKRFLLVLLAALSAAACMQAQRNYFPIGPWCIAKGMDTTYFKQHYIDERQKLLDLGVTYIEGFCNPHDTLWIKNVCNQSNGQIKISTATSPDKPGFSFVDLIGNGGTSWSYQGFLPDNWDSTLRAILDTIAHSYALNDDWAGNYLSHECTAGWDSANWNAYYIATNYAAAYWRSLMDSLGHPALRDRSTNIMPIPAPSYVGSSMQEYASRLNEIGIVENDCYIIRNDVPSTYQINSSEFYKFQDSTINQFVSSADSCWKYFAKPGKGNNAKWHSIFQTFRMEKSTNYHWYPVLRWPTREEVQLQAWLALSRGAKGIKYYLYCSDNPNTPPPENGGEKSSGLLDENRVPRDYPNMHFQPDYSPDSAKYNIYDWVKEINTTVRTLAPVLVGLTCDYAFGVNHALGVTPVLPAMLTSDLLKITGVEAVSPAYHERDFFEVGMFRNDLGEDYFMLVNRYCQPQDTVVVNVKMQYSPQYAHQDYFLVDVLTNETVSQLLPRSQPVTVPITLWPGRGRLLKVIPLQQKMVLADNADYTNFKFVSIIDSAYLPGYPDSVRFTQRYWQTLKSAGNWTDTSSGWLPYRTAMAMKLNLSGENKPNIFKVQFKIDGGQYTTPEMVDSVFYDDVTPIDGGMLINNGAQYTRDTIVLCDVTGTDYFPGINQVRISERPFGCDYGYINLLHNGAFGDTTDWTLGNAIYEDGYLHLLGSYHGGPSPWEDSSIAMQTIPAGTLSNWRGKLVRLGEDALIADAVLANKTVDLVYEDSLSPHNTILLNRSYEQAAGHLWLPILMQDNSDTFTFPGANGRTAHLDVKYQIAGMETPPPPPGGGGTGLNTYMLDNVRFEPIQLIEDNSGGPKNLIISDGWQSLINPIEVRLSPGDGSKIVFMQLKDMCGNISPEPGWTGSIILDTYAPTTMICSPSDFSYISGTVAIRGVAFDQSDAAFSQWTLEYKARDAQTWQTMAASTTPAHWISPTIPPVLFTWHTGSVPYGKYLLRLRALDKAGNQKVDTNEVCVNNGAILPIVAITPEFITFSSLPVDGTTDPAGTIYINDTKDNKVRVYSANGDSLYCFGQKAHGDDSTGFKKPQGISADDSGFVWTTDFSHEKVKKFTNGGVFVLSFGEHGTANGQFREPAGIVTDFKYVYVADGKNDRVQKFDHAGNYIGQFGSGTLNEPTGLAIRYDQVNGTTVEKIYVADSKHDRVVVFDTSGTLADSIMGLGLDKPWDICFDATNNLYIADVENNRVVELDPWHNKLLAFGNHGSEPGEFIKLQGLATSPDGKYLYVIDTHNDRVQRFQMVFDAPTGFNPSSRHAALADPVSYTFALAQNRPNPFMGSTEIKYQLPKQERVSLNIYNINGQLVKAVVNSYQGAGIYTVKWDGKDSRNMNVASGVYLYRLQAGDMSDTKKIVLLR